MVPREETERCKDVLKEKKERGGWERRGVIREFQRLEKDVREMGRGRGRERWGLGVSFCAGVGGGRGRDEGEKEMEEREMREREMEERETEIKGESVGAGGETEEGGSEGRSVEEPRQGRR